MFRPLPGCIRSSCFLPTITLCSSPSKLVRMMPNDATFCAYILTKFCPDRSSNDGWPFFIIISTVFLLLEKLFSLHLPRAMCDLLFLITIDWRGLMGVAWSVFCGLCASRCVHDLTLSYDSQRFHCDDFSISVCSFPSCSILPTFLDWWSPLLLFSCDNLNANTTKRGALTVLAKIYTDKQTCCWFWCCCCIPHTRQLTLFDGMYDLTTKARWAVGGRDTLPDEGAGRQIWKCLDLLSCVALHLV